jgi:parallel beta-helix repeat protein
MTRRPAWTLAGLALCGAALAAAAFDAQRGGSPAAGAAIGSPIAAAAGPPPRVAYAGPRVLRGREALRATLTPGAEPVVAVTFLLDGAPLGSDTTAPYTLDAPVLPSGRHRLRVEAVDRLGNRTAGRPVHVRVERAVDASRGLGGALAALARGDVTVRLAPGRYTVPHVELGSGARLVGSGARTVLAAGRAGWSLATVRGRGVRVSDLAIDGEGRAERGIAVASGSHDVRLQRVRIAGVRTTGVEAWGAHSGVSVQDSVIDGGGASGSGVVAFGGDDSRDTSVIRTRITGFRGYGVNFAQRAFDRPSAALHALALDNRISRIDDPRAGSGTREGGIWSGGVAAAIIGNRIRDTGWDGIQTVGSSREVTIVGNHVARTRVGIYLEHETIDSLIAGNEITDVVTGINVEWRYDGDGSRTNTLERNTILRPAESGIFVDVGGDANRIDGNVIAGGAGPAIVLQGSSGNLVARNRACGRSGEALVDLRSAHHDDGRAAHALGNRLVDNESVAACPER